MSDWGCLYQLADGCVFLDVVPSTSHIHTPLVTVFKQMLLRCCSCAILVCVTVRLAFYWITKCYCNANIAEDFTGCSSTHTETSYNNRKRRKLLG
jgi:hypothetical protein